MKGCNWLISMLIILLTAGYAGAACNSNMAASIPDGQLTVNGDGTVTDAKTHLMWKQCVEGLSGSDCSTGAATAYVWSAALALVKTYSFAGHNDWRLPNIKELQSIVEEQCYGPAVNTTKFPGMPAALLWSNSLYAGDTTKTWIINFQDGQFYYIWPQTSTANVLLVRDIP